MMVADHPGDLAEQRFGWAAEDACVHAIVDADVVKCLRTTSV
jgi:hypothetical protein